MFPIYVTDFGRKEHLALYRGTIQQIKTPGRSRGFFSPRSITSAGRLVGRLVGRPVRAFGLAAGSADRACAGRLVDRPVRANWRSSETKQRSVLARRGYRLNSPSAWRPPSNNSPFPMTLAVTPRCLPPEPARNIASHMRDSPLPLP